MITKDYWFSLKSHVYVEFQKEEILLYDTEKGSHKRITDKNLISLIEGVYEPENLGVVKLDIKLFDDLKTKNTLDHLIDLGIADLTSMKEDELKPIRFIPILNLQSDVDRIKEDVKDETERTILLLGRDTLKYLFEVSIFINNDCAINCEYCKDYCKQMNCCTIGRAKEELSINSIQNILQQIKYSSAYRINILGGNIYKYSNLESLKDLLTPFGDRVYLYMHYKNYKNDSFINGLKIELIVDFSNDDQIIDKVLLSLNKENAVVHFIVKDEIEYGKAEFLIEKYTLTRYEFHPFYSGNNFGFFEENIFLDDDDIFDRPQQMREIFRNKKANKNFFGKLYILPDGTVKANMNKLPLGNIENETILSLINRELLENTAWMLIAVKRSHL